MDREPLPPPFPVGAKVRLRPGGNVPYVSPSGVVEIKRTRTGRRGTLRHLTDEHGPMYLEDTGEPLLDETKDGYSVYEVLGWDKKPMGRIIWPQDAGQWEVEL